MVPGHVIVVQAPPMLFAYEHMHPHRKPTTDLGAFHCSYSASCSQTPARPEVAKTKAANPFLSLLLCHVVEDRESNQQATVKQQANRGSMHSESFDSKQKHTLHEVAAPPPLNQLPVPERVLSGICKRAARINCLNP